MLLITKHVDGRCATCNLGKVSYPNIFKDCPGEPGIIRFIFISVYFLSIAAPRTTRQLRPHPSSLPKSVYLGSPSELPRDPADFRFTVGTSNPITAPFLQQDDLTAWTSDRVAFVDQTLEEGATQLKSRVRIPVQVTLQLTKSPLPSARLIILHFVGRDLFNATSILTISQIRPWTKEVLQ